MKVISNTFIQLAGAVFLACASRTAAKSWSGNVTIYDWSSPPLSTDCSNFSNAEINFLVEATYNALSGCLIQKMVIGNSKAAEEWQGTKQVGDYFRIEQCYDFDNKTCTKASVTDYLCIDDSATCKGKMFAGSATAVGAFTGKDACIRSQWEEMGVKKQGYTLAVNEPDELIALYENACADNIDNMARFTHTWEGNVPTYTYWDKGASCSGTARQYDITSMKYDSESKCMVVTQKIGNKAAADASFGMFKLGDEMFLKQCYSFEGSKCKSYSAKQFLCLDRHCRHTWGDASMWTGDDFDIDDPSECHDGSIGPVIKFGQETPNMPDAMVRIYKAMCSATSNWSDANHLREIPFAATALALVAAMFLSFSGL